MSTKTRQQANKDSAFDPDGFITRISGLLAKLQNVNKRLIEEVAARRKAEAALREREQMIRALLNAPKDTALLIDKTGTILAANETALKRLGTYASKTVGVNGNKLVGQRVYDLFPEEIAKKRRARNLKVMRTGKPGRYVDQRDGSWYDNSIYPVRGSRGTIVGLAIFSKDITDMKRSEEALRHSQETVKALLNAPTDAALLIDPKGDILALNANAADRLSRHNGRKMFQEKLVGKCVYDFFPADLAVDRRARNDEVVTSGKPARFEDERRGLWYDNSTYPVLSPTGGVTALAIVTRDITDQKIAEQMMKKLAYRDPLTKLANRAAFQMRFAASLARAQSRGGSLAVMTLDLDKFKSINDTLGHAAGDSLLRELGARLLTQIRDGDIAARIGGDEFVLVLTGIATAKHASDVAKRILTAIRKPLDIDGHTVCPSSSIGIALYPQHGAYPESLLSCADQAMYRAKEQGTNGHLVFSKRWRSSRPERQSPLTENVAAS